QLTVTGTTSGDVSVVNVYCLSGVGPFPEVTTVATSVSSSTGKFSATVPVPGGVEMPQCRLRALPQGVNPVDDYLASYSGPLVNLDSWRYFESSETFQLSASSRTGMLVADGIGSCSTTFLGTVLPDLTVPGGSNGCYHGLGLAQGATHSSVRVDGHEAYTTSAA